MVQSLEASESKSNGFHFYSSLNGFTSIGLVKSVCEIVPILRLVIDFLTIDVSSENRVCGTIWIFFWYCKLWDNFFQMLIESLIPPVQSLLSSFFWLCFYWIWLCVGKITTSTSFCKEDRLYFPIIQGTS